MPSVILVIDVVIEIIVTLPTNPGHRSYLHPSFLFPLPPPAPLFSGRRILSEPPHVAAFFFFLAYAATHQFGSGNDYGRFIQLLSASIAFCTQWSVSRPHSSSCRLVKETSLESMLLGSDQSTLISAAMPLVPLRSNHLSIHHIPCCCANRLVGPKLLDQPTLISVAVSPVLLD